MMPGQDIAQDIAQDIEPHGAHDAETVTIELTAFQRRAVAAAIEASLTSSTPRSHQTALMAVHAALGFAPGFARLLERQELAAPTA